MHGQARAGGHVTNFRQARHARLYEDVAAQLREEILSGGFAPGDRLPVERELMSEFGVSRAVVRQATMNLEHEGLVEVQVGAGGGTFVLESGVDTVLRACENLFRHRGVPVDDYLAAKRLLEPALSSAIIEGSGADHQRLLVENLGRCREAVHAGADDRELLQLNLEFHEILIRAVGNPVVEALLIALVRMGVRVPAFVSSVRADWLHILAEHEDLLDALRRGRKARFTRLMLAHLDTVGGIYSDEVPQPPSLDPRGMCSGSAPIGSSA